MGPDTEINLHVFGVGASQIDRMLCFRDRLRTQQADRDYYERTKRALAQRVWRHVVHYAEAKTPVIQEILDRAKAQTVAAATVVNHDSKPSKCGSTPLSVAGGL